MDIKQDSSCRFLFGPVPSRRLGNSLGIDTVPFKTCTYDCVYCQLGKTTDKTCERQLFFPVDEILQELAQYLPRIPRPDYITLSGSGEPTLYKNLADIIEGIKEITDIDVAVLTNGSLFWIEDVRRSVMNADLLIPSLDAGDEETFLQINRPHPEITFDKMIEGLCLMRSEFAGPVWLEVFLVNNVTTKETQLEKIKAFIDRIKPDSIQLNTAVRGAAEDFVEAVSMERMDEIREYFGNCCEVIAHEQKIIEQSQHAVTKEDIYNLLKRRPCSIEDISIGLRIHRNEVIKHVSALQGQNIITTKRSKDKVLYVVRDA